MIPKIIHYATFRGYQITDLNRRCMESWKRVLPDYQIHHWTQENGPQDFFFRQAVEMCPVNACNFIRYWALHNFGGVYMDLDVEVLKPFDLEQECFLAFQRDDTQQDCINSAVMGSAKGHPFFVDMLKSFHLMRGNIWPVHPSCTVPTEILYSLGMKGLNVEQKVGDIMVYDKERFYPWSWTEKPDMSKVTERTFAIHHWEGSWK